MKIRLHHPAREVSLKGPKAVEFILKELNLSREAHLVIREEELATEDTIIGDDETVEIRPVISGGSGSAGPSAARGGIGGPAFCFAGLAPTYYDRGAS